MPNISDNVTVINAARLLGDNLLVARKRRRETQDQFAVRIGVTRQTLAQMEHGSLAVAFGHYVRALWVLGMVDQVADLANPDKDIQGKVAEREAQPERVRPPRSRERYEF